MWTLQEQLGPDPYFFSNEIGHINIQLYNIFKTGSLTCRIGVLADPVSWNLRNEDLDEDL